MALSNYGFSASGSCVPDLTLEPLSLQPTQGFRPECFSCASLNCSDLPVSKVRDLTIDFGKHKGKTQEDLLSQLGNSHTSVGHHRKGLITNGQCSHGQLKELMCLMCLLGPDTDVATYANLLQRCTVEKALSKGECVHEHITRHGFADNIFLSNLLVQMYGKCGSLQYARVVFQNMFSWNSYSWTIMLAAYAQNGHGMEAVLLFDQMQVEGFDPGKVTFICVLDACGNVAALRKGREVHAHIFGNGWESDIVLTTALVNMYGKCGSVDDARAVFVEMPLQNVVSWSAMITACVQNGHGREALQFFGQMQAEGFEPNKVTFICALDACASVAAIEKGREIHCSVVSNGYDMDVVLGTALLNMYNKSGSLDDARAVFAEMPHRDVVSWNAMITVCVQTGHSKEALQLFGQMQTEGFQPDQTTFSCILDACATVTAIQEGREIHASIVGEGWEPGVFVRNALINMYGNCGHLDDAKDVFADMPWPNVVSWNTIIAVCAQNEHGKDALQLFAKMQAEGFEPNKITVTCALDACASVAALQKGREIHDSVIGNDWQSDIVVGTALVNMYGNCGSLSDARAVFLEMQRRDVVSWSAMIAVSAQNGYGKEALELFGQMQAESIKPNEITFISVLNACSHMGLVADGRRYFSSMTQDHHISPWVDHYLCMIDLLGRAGQLDKAEQLINAMPCEPVTSAWLSLLSSCRIHGEVERGARAANHVFNMEKDNVSPYILLANIYAVAGRWDDVEKLRKAMVNKGVKKVLGRSCIEVKNVVHEFITGDTAHPQWEHIYAEVQKLSRQIEEARFRPDTSAVLQGLDEEYKEHTCFYHSEKLAIAFGLISTPPGTPIRVTKNLRMCSDCHSAAKFISKVHQRRILVRDANRLHHLEHGICSCGGFL